MLVQDIYNLDIRQTKLSEIWVKYMHWMMIINV